MEYYCISASHHNTPLNVREKFSFSPAEIQDALNYYSKNNQRFLGPDTEIAILSTCNRTEIYSTVPSNNLVNEDLSKETNQRFFAFLSEIIGNTPEDLVPYFKSYYGPLAVEHLFRVTAGLESQVLGESQIIGQVSQALTLALETGSARHTLASLFRAALHAAKRAHAETAIDQNPASLSSAAAHMAELLMGEISSRSVLVIGAGEMSALAAKAFHLRGANDMTIASRTYAHAYNLAAQYGAQALPLAELGPALQKADIVISATAAPRTILDVNLMKSAMDCRPGRPVLLLDIALPRDIDPAVRHIPGVQLADLDDLKARVDQTFESRQKEAEQAEAILCEELSNFSHWMEIIPTVGKLHRKAEKIRRDEVTRMLQHTPDLDPRILDQINRLTRSLVKKLLHEPTTKMRTGPSNTQMIEYTSTLNFLFGLDEAYDQINETSGRNNHD